MKPRLSMMSALVVAGVAFGASNAHAEDKVYCGNAGGFLGAIRCVCYSNCVDRTPSAYLLKGGSWGFALRNPWRSASIEIYERVLDPMGIDGFGDVRACDRHAHSNETVVYRGKNNCDVVIRDGDSWGW